MKIKKYQNGGFTEAFNNFQNKRKLRIAQEQARQQVQNEKPKLVFSNPYDITAGWRNATEDAAREDKYTALNLGATPEEAEKIYDTTWDNSRKQLATTSATVLPTAAAMAVSMGSAGPVAADVVNSLFAADAVKNLASNNGIQKTYRLARQGDTWGAIKSGAWDALDLSMLGHTAGLVGRIGKSILNGSTFGNAYRSDIAGRAFRKSVNNTSSIPKVYSSIPEKVEYSHPVKIGSSKFSDYNRDVDKEMIFKTHEDYEFGKWNPNKLNGWSVKNHLDKTRSQIYRDKYNFLDRTYDGRYTVDPEKGFIRRNQGGIERAEFIRKHPINNLNATTAGETSIEEQINSAERNFAKKYQNDFKINFNKAVKYDALAGTELGYSEGTIIGPFVEHFGITPGQIKFKHTFGDISPLARIVENHEAHHATGNMDDPFVLRYLIEKGIIDESKLSNYLKDADRGEVTAHLSELPDWLGFTGRTKGKYTGHPFGKTEITESDIYNYNKFNHQNGFKHTIWDAINPNKMHEFVKFMNEHPFVITLPIAGVGGTALSKQKQGRLLNEHNT